MVSPGIDTEGDAAGYEVMGGSWAWAGWLGLVIGLVPEAFLLATVLRGKGGSGGAGLGQHQGTRFNGRAAAHPPAKLWLVADTDGFARAGDLAGATGQCGIGLGWPGA
jgi:hypothetical protein